MWKPCCDEEECEKQNDDVNLSTEVRVCLGIQAKQIVLNVYNTLKSENEPTAASDIIKRTSKLTDVPCGTIYKIVKYGVQTRKKRSDKGSSKNIAIWQVDIIRQTIYGMYRQNEVPTLSSLKERLMENDAEMQCSVTTLWRALKSNGFKYGKIDKRRVIMESERIRKLRYEYLTNIRKFREDGRFICFLDETWYDTHDTEIKGWLDNTDKCTLNVPASRGKRIIILHCGSENGWVGEMLLSAKNIKSSHLDYHEDMTSELFEEWFQKKLLPVLPARSVIVMDNAPYHSRQASKIPGLSSTKPEIARFLELNDLYYEDSYTKAQLLEVLRTKTFEKQYYVDNMAASAGHTVLRLPPYYCIFNPIELIWSQLKKYVRRNNVNPKFSESALNLIRNAAQNITPQDWRQCIRHTVSMENEYYQNTCTNQEFIIHLSDCDETSVEDSEQE